MKIAFTNDERTITIGHWWWKRVAEAEKRDGYYDKQNCYWRGGWYYEGSQIRIGQDAVMKRSVGKCEELLDAAAVRDRQLSFWRRPQALPEARALREGGE